MDYAKVSFVERNEIYGDKTIVGYGRDGLAVHKVGRSAWTISHVFSGRLIRSGSDWTTKENALDHLEALLALPIAWQKSWEAISGPFSTNRDIIRAIVMDGVGA